MRNAFVGARRLCFNPAPAAARVPRLACASLHTRTNVAQTLQQPNHLAQQMKTSSSASSIDARLQGMNVSNVTAHTVNKSADGFSVSTWSGGDVRFWWGLASTQGRRPNMEDAHAVDLNIDGQHTALFGVFDGHAGKEVAAYCARHMREAVVSSSAFRAGHLEDSLAQAFVALEERMREPAARHELFCLREGINPGALSKHSQAADVADGYGTRDQDSGAYLGPKAGATACVALVRDSQLCVASVGDSRCVLSDSGRAVVLTRDHKAKDPEEARRVVKAGLSIAKNRVVKEGNSLAMTRALGDTRYKETDMPHDKQGVSPLPDTSKVEVDFLAGAAAGTPAVKELGVADFMVLACDGLWDCMSNQQAVTFVQVGMEKGLSPQQAAQALTEEVLSANSVTPATMDNVTVLVVQFAPMPDVAA